MELPRGVYGTFGFQDMIQGSHFKCLTLVKIVFYLVFIGIWDIKVENKLTVVIIDLLP